MEEPTPDTEPEFQSPREVAEERPSYKVPDYPGMKPPKNRKKSLIVIPLVIIVVGALGFGGYKIFGHKKSTPKTVTNASTDIPDASNKDVPLASSTKTYENGFLGVTLSYPDTWTTTESDNKASVRLESPNFSYLTTSKGTVTGNFRIYIRKGARTIDGKYIGRGYAIQPSEKLTYAKPAVGQRTDTNLSLFGLDTPDNFAFFMIAGNYNLKKGDTLGPNYGKEQETYIIVGGYSSKDLKDDLATNPVSTDMIKTSNAYKQATDILKSLQLN